MSHARLTYRCHTADDTCSDGSDCALTEECRYDALVKHWACTPINCQSG
jgi:hypothetical protein